ncbi:Nucleoporin nup84 [Rhizophlyctis rosea]|nr:Nucleoporin nup84 [Rhizophlyctis rosea]
MAEAVDFLIETYVDILGKARKNNLVVTYVRSLPSDRQVQAYANFLQHIPADRAVRTHLLKLADDQGLTVHRIAVRTEELRRDNTQFVRLTSLTDRVGEQDAWHIHALDYIELAGIMKSNLRASLQDSQLVMGNQLLRRFLAEGKVHAALLLIQSLPLEAELKNQRWQMDANNIEHNDPTKYARAAFLAEARDERIACNGLISVIKQHEAWSKLFFSRPTDGSRQAEHIWNVNMMATTKETVSQLEKLLENDWLHFEDRGTIDDDDTRRSIELQILRDLYIPQLFLWLHQVLYETRQMIQGFRNAEKSLYLAEQVADPKYEYWKEFRGSGKLEKFLRDVRRSALAVVDNKAGWPWASEPVAA